jgi:hypothetical protein
MQRISGRTIFGAAVVLVVFASAAFGVWVIGSPQRERQRQFDEQRVQALLSMRNYVQSYYARERSLPKDWQSIADTFFETPSTQLFDPETHTPYEYYLQDAADGTYTLCAVFAAATSDNPDERMMYRAWAHPAGKYCFSLSAKTGVIVGLDPVRAPSKPCVGSCAEPAVPEPTPVQEGDLRDIPKVCSLMRSKSDGSMHCVACLATDSHVCRDVAMDWEFYDAAATPGRVGIPYGCFMTETGCALAQ